MCCGEDVPATRIERHGRAELICSLCGFTLELQEPAARQDLAPAAVSCIVTVDDAATHLERLRELLERSGLAEQVIALHSGAEFVSVIASRFAQGLPVALVILDVEMPALDGFTAARFLRSLEAKMSRPPCPVIFFTGRTADENLRKQMKIFGPAWYCAKGADPDLASFDRRATGLVRLIAGKIAGQGAPG